MGFLFFATCLNKKWFVKSEDEILNAETPNLSKKSTLFPSYGVDKKIIPRFLHLLNSLSWSLNEGSSFFIIS